MPLNILQSNVGVELYKCNITFDYLIKIYRFIKNNLFF